MTSGIQSRLFSLCASNAKEKLTINALVMMVSVTLLRRHNTQNGIMILSKRMLLLPLILMTMVKMMVELVWKWRSHFKKLP